MVEDDTAINNLLLYFNAFRRPRHKRGPCRTFVLKYIIELHPQYLNNPETVTSTVESEHDKTNTLICRPSEFYYQPGHPQRLISLRPSEESCCRCLFDFNDAFSNFSVISRRCLVAAGSSMLTFIVLPHWSIIPQTPDMISHPVTLSWHSVDQF